MRTVGTVVRGIRCPIFREGDDLVEQVIKALLAAASHEGFAFRDHDIVGITESAVARTQGNYVSVDEIADEVRRKFPDGELAVVFPILSRNRFAVILKGIAKACKKLHLLLSYPADEVGNHLVDPDLIDDLEVDVGRQVFDENSFRALFGGEIRHPFTGLDYVALYKDIIGSDKAAIYLGNDPRSILTYCKKILIADVHGRQRSRKLLMQAGAELVYGLEDLCAEPAYEGAGYNETYGLLGSNLASEDSVKLFPRGCQELVDRMQRRLKEVTGKHIEVMVYGDGAFKDPVGKIWELADPVVSPGFTAGLAGTPNELKLKFLADEAARAGQDPDAVEADILNKIRQKQTGSVTGQASLGTTPRRLSDLLGSLCDLTSGSGDKGTPVVFIQGYFDNFAD
ncbi:MAG: F420-0--gamma-glutamyl ligase [Oligosphaeraceae bacterium]|nr:F420-0--gamma-glutamyl ligase [Oligosphaeraceae bacterium]